MDPDRNLFSQSESRGDNAESIALYGSEAVEARGGGGFGEDWYKVGPLPVITGFLTPITRGYKNS